MGVPSDGDVSMLPAVAAESNGHSHGHDHAHCGHDHDEASAKKEEEVLPPSKRVVTPADACTFSMDDEVCVSREPWYHLQD